MEVSGAEAKAGEHGILILDILRRVGCGMTIMQIASATGRSKQAVYDALNRLEGGGLVQRVGKNLWDLTKQ
jgi:DNA-binding IclR family transcriptional regulator